MQSTHDFFWLIRGHGGTGLLLWPAFVPPPLQGMTAYGQLIN
jgi:hypothetical protein